MGPNQSKRLIYEYSYLTQTWSHIIGQKLSPRGVLLGTSAEKIWKIHRKKKLKKLKKVETYMPVTLCDSFQKIFRRFSRPWNNLYDTTGKFENSFYNHSWPNRVAWDELFMQLLEKQQKFWFQSSGLFNNSKF